MHHDESQSNKKSTPTADIAPGAPIWYRSASGVHNNRDIGHGYGAQDPVSLTTADTRNNSGGYTSGSSITRFGSIGLEQTQLVLGHGSKSKFRINRKGGTVGDQVITLKVYRDGPTDENTATIGSVRGDVVDGFSTCQVDIDLVILNNPDLVYWDETAEQFAILLEAGKDYIEIEVLAPYRTKVASLLPSVLTQPITYRVDEYYSTGLSELHTQFKENYSDYAQYLEDQPDNMVINNHQTQYSIATLPVPGWWVDKAGNDAVGVDGKLYSREIDRYNTHAIPLTGMVDNPPEYTIGKIRNVEATGYIRLDEMEVTPFSGTNLWETLSAEGWWPGGAIRDPLKPDEVYFGTPHDFGTNYIMSTGGEFWDFSGEITTTGTLTAPLTSEDAFKKHPIFNFKTYSGSNGALAGGSGYVSRILELGTDPDDTDPDPVSPGRGGVVTWGTYEKSELDPAGDSEFRWFTLPDLPKLKYGNHLGVGDIAYPVFHWQGVNPLSLPDKQTKMVLTKSYPSVSALSESHPQLELPDFTNESSLSAFYHLNKLKTRNSIIERGMNFLESDWVARETTLSAISASLSDEDRTEYMNSRVLYDLTQLQHDAELSYINKSYLKGFYMTCADHQDKKLVLKLGSIEAEPIFELEEKNIIEITIDKTVPYTTEQHADLEDIICEKTGEEPLVYRKNVMKHRTYQGGVTWSTGDSWSDHGYNDPFAEKTSTYKPQLTAGPTGDSLLQVLFGEPIQMTVSPTVTGYTTEGVLSGNDVTFLSFIPGVLNSQAFSKSANPADAQPGTVSLSAIVYSDDAGVEFEEPLLVVDLKQETSPVIDVPMDNFPPGALVWLYMSNPGGKTLSVMLDQMTLTPSDPLEPDNQVLVKGPKLLGTYLSENVYYWYSKYSHDAGDLYSPSLASATIYEGEVTKLGGIDTNGIYQFELDPLTSDDCLFAIDPNDIEGPDGPVDNTSTNTIKQIYQLYQPGEQIVQGTITFNFIR